MKRLNRTSVGLKHSSKAFSPSLITEPQSNQRGIETDDSKDHVINAPAPQSNQRGIETPPRQGKEHMKTCASIEPAWD